MKEYRELASYIQGIGVGRCFPYGGRPAGQNLPDAKAVCGHITCLHRANVMGAAAPIAPMVPMPMQGGADERLVDDQCGRMRLEEKFNCETTPN